MADKRVLELCDKCASETRTSELRKISPGTKWCPSCHMDECTHEQTRTSPHGKEWCTECKKVVEGPKGQTTIGTFP